MTSENVVGKNFRIVSSLSNGGFGQTFLAEDLRFSNAPKCVVKQLKPQSADPNIIAVAGRLFAQEVKTLYQLGTHPQIPSIVTHFEENGEFYFVQQFVEGNTYAEEIELGKIYGQAEVFEIVRQLLEILAFVHGQGVIHRDIKPSNLINRASDGKVVLIDFGAVKEVGRQNFSAPQQGTIAIGSDGYMPMEQLAGFPTFASDIYAVGMFGVHLLTKTHPTQLRQNQRTGEWIWQDKTSVNPRYAEILSRMIRLDFRQRFQNAGEVLNAMRGFNINAPQQPENFPPPNQPHYRNQFGSQPQFNQPQFPQNQNPTRQKMYPQTVVEPIYPTPTAPPPIVNRQNAPLISQFPQPAQTRLATKINPPPMSERPRESSESVTLGGFAYDDLSESPIVRAFLTMLVIVVAIWLLMTLLTYFTKPSQSGLPPEDTIERKAAPIEDNAAVALKNAATELQVQAREKHDKAKTSLEWQMVADAWYAAEKQYNDVIYSNATKKLKDEARKEKYACVTMRNAALKEIAEAKY